jgi:glycosyltransferase involved in cell wall biosynthesis
VTHGTETPTVTLLVAMRNEERFIEGCLRSILAQDYDPELLEVLVLDGLSSDRSVPIAQGLVGTRGGWRVLENRGVTQSSGWNLGIAEASGEVVGIVSAHAELAPDYVSRAVETLLRTGADLVGGPVRAHGLTYVGRAIAIGTGSPFGVGHTRGQEAVEGGEVDTVFQGVCRRALYDRIGGFDEEMVRNQDDELSYRLRRHGGRIVSNPAIRSVYYNRGTVPSLARQYFHYGFWKVRVMQLLARQMRPRQFAPAVLVVVLLATGVWAVVADEGRLALAVVAGSYLIANLVATAVTAYRHGLRYAPLLPVVFATLHLAYGSGFLVGLVRWYVLRRGRRPAESPALEAPLE